MTSERRASTVESAFGDITNRHVRIRGDGRAATESKARLVGRRAAALLVDPTGLSEEILEVEEWAVALNDRDARDGPDVDRTPVPAELEEEDADASADDAEDPDAADADADADAARRPGALASGLRRASRAARCAGA